MIRPTIRRFVGLGGGTGRHDSDGWMEICVVVDAPRRAVAATGVGISRRIYGLSNAWSSLSHCR